MSKFFLLNFTCRYTLSYFPDIDLNFETQVCLPLWGFPGSHSVGMKVAKCYHFPNITLILFLNRNPGFNNTSYRHIV